MNEANNLSLNEFYKRHSTGGIQYQPGVKLEEVEKQWIINALKFFNGNKTHAANSLGISIRTLYNKLDLYEGKVTTDAEINSLHPEARIQLESHVELPSQQPVPMYEREEIQELPSQPTSTSDKNRGSGKRKAGASES